MTIGARFCSRRHTPPSRCPTYRGCKGFVGAVLQLRRRGPGGGDRDRFVLNRGRKLGAGTPITRRRGARTNLLRQRTGGGREVGRTRNSPACDHSHAMKRRRAGSLGKPHLEDQMISRSSIEENELRPPEELPQVDASDLVDSELLTTAVKDMYRQVARRRRASSISRSGDSWPSGSVTRRRC